MKLFAVTIASIVLTSCASVPQRIIEPNRSMFVFRCMQANLPVTACLCLEQKLIEMKGTDFNKYEQIDMAVAQDKCTKELKDTISKEMEAVQREPQIQRGDI